MEMQINKVNLTEEERQRYCDKPFYRMIQLLIMAENKSYIMFDQSHIDRCNREILANFGNLTSKVTLHQKKTSADSADQSSSNPESPSNEK